MARQVTVGGEPRTVPPLNMTKFRVAGKLISRLSQHLSDAMLGVAEYSQQYGEINKLVITRKMNQERNMGFTDHDFGDRPYVELPSPPPDEQQIAVGVARVYDQAEADVARLCALILAPKDDLKDARRNDTIDLYLDNAAESIMDDAEPDEIVEILSVALEMSRERFQGKDLAGKLRRAWSPESPSGSQSPGDKSNGSGENVTEHPAAGRMPVIGTATKDGDQKTTSVSSTDSPESTDGPPNTSSTTSQPVTSSATSG